MAGEAVRNINARIRHGISNFCTIDLVKTYRCRSYKYTKLFVRTCN